MSYRQGWDTLLRVSGDTVGGKFNEAFAQGALGEALVQASCELAREDPRFGNLTSYEKGFYKGLCSEYGYDIDEVQRPGNAYTGGQCPVPYFIIYDVVYQNQTIPDREVGAHYGKIHSVELDDDGFVVITHGTRDNPEAKVMQRYGSGASQGGYTDLSNVRVRRSDGEADDCGDGEPPVLEPPTGEKCFDIVFSGETQPTTFCRSHGQPFDSEFCFETDEYIVCVSPDGISITSKDDLEKPVGKKPFNEDDFEPKTPECIPPEEFEQLSEEEKEGGIEACESDVEELKWLLVQITEFPNLGKAIFHPKPENTDYYAGYVVWYINTKGGQFTLPAIPIRKAKMAFKPPEDINGYRVYTTNKAKVKLTELKEKPSNG